MNSRDIFLFGDDVLMMLMTMLSVVCWVSADGVAVVQRHVCDEIGRVLAHCGRVRCRSEGALIVAGACIAMLPCRLENFAHRVFIQCQIVVHYAYS